MARKVYEVGSCEWLEQNKNLPGVAGVYAQQIEKCRERKEAAEALAREKKAERERERLLAILRGRHKSTTDDPPPPATPRIFM